MFMCTLLVVTTEVGASILTCSHITLQALGDIQIALKMLGNKREEKENPVDQHYHGLHCSITPLEHSDKVFSLVEKYVRQTHGKTHTQYTLQVLDVYALEREGEEEVFADVGNR